MLKKRCLFFHNETDEGKSEIIINGKGKVETNRDKKVRGKEILGKKIKINISKT